MNKPFQNLSPLSSPNPYYSRYHTYVKPILKSPTVRLYGTYTLTIFTVTIFIFFAIKPTIETISVLQKKLEDSKQVLAQVTQKSENLSLAKKNYEALDTNIKQKIVAAVPTKVLLQSIIHSLEQSVQTNQASISALQFQPLTLVDQTNTLSNHSLTTIDFTFNVEGPYLGLLNVLKAIQQSPRLISIEGLMFNKTSDSDIIVLSINGKAYYLK